MDEQKKTQTKTGRLAKLNQIEIFICVGLDVVGIVVCLSFLCNILDSECVNSTVLVIVISDANPCGHIINIYTHTQCLTHIKNAIRVAIASDRAIFARATTTNYGGGLSVDWFHLCTQTHTLNTYSKASPYSYISCGVTCDCVQRSHEYMRLMGISPFLLLNQQRRAGCPHFL